MKWRVYLYSVLFVFLGLLFGSFIINQGNSVFATSVTCSSTLASNNSSYVGSCDLSSLDSSVVWYYYVTPSSDLFSSASFDSQNRVCFYDSLFCSSSATTSSGRFAIPINQGSSIIYGSTPFIFSDFGSFRFLNFGVYVSSFTFSSDLSFTSIISDTNPFSSSSAPSGSISITQNGTYDVTSYSEAVVNVENEVIYGDYHDDLVSINNTIMIGCAIPLVIYFFYCIYRMLLKGRI